MPVDAGDPRLNEIQDIRWSLADAAFPASLPIEISPLSRQREPLSLASYQPKTSLANRAEMIVSAFPVDRRHTTSSNSLRMASYAERDRSRAIDSGALDFVAGKQNTPMKVRATTNTAGWTWETKNAVGGARSRSSRREARFRKRACG